MQVTVDVDVRVLSPNALHREWWRTRAARRRREVQATVLAFRGVVFPPGPWTVTMVRVGVNLMDSDGAMYACKTIRDTVAHLLGVTDAPTDDRVHWRYGQAKARHPETMMVKGKVKTRYRSWVRVTVASRAGAPLTSPDEVVEGVGAPPPEPTRQRGND
jgi:hypothetical protein